MLFGEILAVYPDTIKASKNNEYWPCLWGNYAYYSEEEEYAPGKYVIRKA